MRIQLDEKTFRYLFILIAAITPFCFKFSPVIFVFFIFLAAFFLSIKKKGFENRFALLLLYTVLFSGITIAFFRPYDIVIIGCLFFQIIKYKNNMLKIPVRIVPFACIVLVNLFIHFTSESAIEASRYILCIILFLEARRGTFDFNSFSREFLMIIACNIYFAISVFLLWTFGFIDNYTTGLVTSNIYLYDSLTEVRLNGFFSDPNKYMAFCFTLLFIAESYLKKGRERKIIVLLTIVASVISLSRTALIVIFVFLLLKILLVLKDRYKPLFVLSLIFLVACMIIALFFPERIINLVNYLYVQTSMLMGRDFQLTLSTTIQGDNRTRIWQMAIDLIKKNILFGYGWMSNEWLLPYPTHNTILAVLLDGGVIALFAYIVMVWPLIICKRWELVASLIVVPALMLDLQNYRVLFFLLGLIQCPSLLLNKQNE